MKTIQKILSQVIILASIMLNQSTVLAQTCLYTGATPPRTELLSEPYLDFTSGVANGCGNPGTFNLTGIGANMTTPAYMLDILCNPLASPATNLDVNISCPNCANPIALTGQDAVGYRIGGNMFAWHSGDLSSTFIGIGSGYLYTPASPLPNPFNDTYIGYNV